MVDDGNDKLSNYVVASFIEVARKFNEIHYVLSGAV